MKRSILLCLSLSVASAVASASPCQLVYPGWQSGSQYDGPTKCALGTLSGITVNGPLGTANTKFTSAVVVHGPLKASSGRFEALTVDGPIKGLSMDVRGEATVNGPINVDKSHFKDVSVAGPITATKSNFGDIQMKSNYASFTNSHTKNITMKNNNTSSFENTKLYLQGKSVVDGDITFIGKPGVVYKGSDVKISGRVHNGKVNS